jgi:hypothetical protein
VCAHSRHWSSAAPEPAGDRLEGGADLAHAEKVRHPPGHGELDEPGHRKVNQLPVLEDGKLVGLLRREDVLKWLSLHEGASAEV